MNQHLCQRLSGRATKLLGVFVCLLWSLGATAAERGPTEPAAYADVWGPAVDSTLPLLDAPDQTGRQRQLADLAGDQGLLLFLVRSADW